MNSKVRRAVDSLKEEEKKRDKITKEKVEYIYEKYIQIRMKQTTSSDQLFPPPPGCNLSPNKMKTTLPLHRPKPSPNSTQTELN